MAQTLKEWRQCSGGEGPIVDVIISGCSAVIQAGQDNPRLLATAFNNRGVAYKFKGEYDYRHPIQFFRVRLALVVVGGILLTLMSVLICRS